MKEFESEDLNQAQSTAVQPAENSFGDHFASKRGLPLPLEALNEISLNFYWSWVPEGAELFREIDPGHWEKCEQNPRLFLRTVAELRLLLKSTDRTFLGNLQRFKDRMDLYLAEPPISSGKVTRQAPAAYFCAEYGVHNSLPTYSGGLGILAGDHLKSASDLNIPLVAIGLLYRYGYFRQKIGHDGWQEEDYLDVFDSVLALSLVKGPSGERLTVSVNIRGRDVLVQAWLARIGRISLYLLDTNVDGNEDVDRLITGHLYGGSTETRIVQEQVLGIAGVRFLRKLRLSPSIFHLNEGHSAFLTLELAREYLELNLNATFEDARTAIRKNCVFTTHTPVAAGNDIFSAADLRSCFDAKFLSALKLTEDDFFALGRVDPNTESEAFGMTPLAIRMCRSANGVSRKHGEVSRDLWTEMFPMITNAKDVPITHVTNGVHAPTWIAPLLQELYRGVLGMDWDRCVNEPTAWAAAIDGLSDTDVWSTHIMLKRILIAYLRHRTQHKDTGDFETIHEHIDTHQLFSPDVLTIGFARRVAAYKRWNLMLSDLERLLKLVDDRERPVQFVFAGKAHPQDRTAKQILQQLMSINHDSHWQDRAVFVEDYDQDVAKYLVQGVDVWMNVPRRPLEASGTSGMKAAMNGALNFSVLDGWWLEGFDGSNGFAIGHTRVSSDEEMDKSDAESFYDVLENQVIPAYYERDERNIPCRWVGMMKRSLATLTPQFSSDRMIGDYLKRIYNTLP